MVKVHGSAVITGLLIVMTFTGVMEVMLILLLMMIPQGLSTLTLVIIVLLIIFGQKRSVNKWLLYLAEP